MGGKSSVTAGEPPPRGFVGGCVTCRLADGAVLPAHIPAHFYGVAWTLLHLIETGPNPVVTTAPEPDDNEWHQRLYDRAVFGGLISRT